MSDSCSRSYLVFMTNHMTCLFELCSSNHQQSLRVPCSVTPILPWRHGDSYTGDRRCLVSVHGISMSRAVFLSAPSTHSALDRRSGIAKNRLLNLAFEDAPPPLDTDDAEEPKSVPADVFKQGCVAASRCCRLQTCAGCDEFALGQAADGLSVSYRVVCNSFASLTQQQLV